MNASDRLLINRARNYGKWWLHIHEQQKGSVQENVDRSEMEVRKSNVEFDDQAGVVYGNKQMIEEYCTNVKPCPYGLMNIDRECKVIENYIHLDDHSNEELNMIIGDDLKKSSGTRHNICSKDACTENSDSFSCQNSQQSAKICSELDSYLNGLENSEPWLYASDKGELASFVTYHSQSHLEHHDNLGRRVFGRSSTACSYNYDEVKDETDSYIPTETRSTLKNLASAIEDEAMTATNPLECSANSSPKLHRNDGSNATNQVTPETALQSDHNSNRVHLLEALCHSQTRAREAEKFVQQNCDEKEQIIKLYFKQASQLFAYRQWLEILGLENLLLQLRNSGAYMSANLPILPKGRQTTKSKRWTEKRNRGKPQKETMSYFIAFALGLGLTGAGLLLGWTIGWLCSTF